MSNRLRFRSGQVELHKVRVDSDTELEAGDLVWLDTDDVKPASAFTWTTDLATTQAVHGTTSDASAPISLAELWERHDQLLDDLGDIPIDPTPHLTAHTERLAAVENHLTDFHAPDDTAGPKRRWWHRKHPDLTATATAGRAASIGAAEAQRTELRGQVQRLAVEVQAYEQWLDVKADTLDEVDELAEQIDWRAAQAGRAAELTRPGHVIDVIGPPPVGDRNAWRAAAAAIESYNARFADVPDHLLDQHPDHAEHHEQVQLAVETATQPVVLDPAPTLTLR